MVHYIEAYLNREKVDEFNKLSVANAWERFTEWQQAVI